MKRINIDRENDRVKNFVRSLPVDPDGSVLELEGKPMFRIVPLSKADSRKLRAAILRRRNISRKLNQEWADADRDVMRKQSEAQD